MGESKRKLKKSRECLLSCAGVQAVAGRIQVKWATDSAATPMSQLTYFAAFLTLSGLWQRWVERCPLEYKRDNASTKSDILGIWLLSILSDHKHYAYVTAIRSYGVNPGLQGMNGVVAKDPLRRALQAIPGKAGVAWLDRQIDEASHHCSMFRGYLTPIPRSS